MTFYEKIRTLCLDRGTSVTAIATELGYSKSAATTWKKSKGLPRASTIKRLAEYFDITTAELMDGIEEVIDFDAIDTSSFDQPVWKHILEQHNYNEQAAIRAYLKFEDARKQDALSMNGNNMSHNHGVIGTANAPVTIINGSQKKLTEQEVALLDIFEKLDVVKKAQLLAYAANLQK